MLRIEAPLIDIDQPFVEFGLDSFLGTELIIAINREYGPALSNVKSLAIRPSESLRVPGTGNQKLPGYPSEAPAATDGRGPHCQWRVLIAGLKRKIRAARTITSNQAPSDDRIAIIGMSGRYPQANSLQEYWDNLVEGRNSIVEVPPSRWDAQSVL